MRPIAHLFREPRQSPHTEGRYLKQNGGADKQKSRLHQLSQRSRHARPYDRTESCAGRDESEQPLALLGVEDIDHYRPEDRDDEKVEHRDPDKEESTDPYHLLRRGPVQRRAEHQDGGSEETVGKRDELLARQKLHECRKRHVQDQHGDQRAREQPWQIIHPTGHTHLVADGTQDVVRGKDRENVEPTPAERRSLGWCHIYQATKEAMKRVVRRRGGVRIGFGHLTRPKRSRNALPVSCWP